MIACEESDNLIMRALRLLSGYIIFATHVQGFIFGMFIAENWKLGATHEEIVIGITICCIVPVFLMDSPE